MKSKILFILSALVIALPLSLSLQSCGDDDDEPDEPQVENMEQDINESDSVVTDPSLDEKTDSINYTLGIFRSVQELADQLVLINEMRGDLVTANSHTSTDLKALANYDNIDADNQYASAYRFYRVINNCNYYIAYRNTDLSSSADMVAIPEYVQALAIRAWTYMQLAKLYGEVPFYTHPILNISDANAQNDTKTMEQIADALLPELIKYSGTRVPNYGDITVGKSNDGSGDKVVNSQRIMFPVDLVIADLCLESEKYEQAAQYYFNYLKDQKLNASTDCKVDFTFYINEALRSHIPAAMMTSGFWGSGIFEVNNKPSFSNEVITYIPMAVNSMRGQVTELPAIFGYDYYSTDISKSERYLCDRQVNPSAAYNALALKQTYYYPDDNEIKAYVSNEYPFGDTRRMYTWGTLQNELDSTFSIMRKILTANVFVYRTSTVYLRLAEALNRMGYPDAAFAILKDGMSKKQLKDAIYKKNSEIENFEKYLELKSNNTYIRTTTYDLLTTTIPFLNCNIFQDVSEGAGKGIHSHGSNAISGLSSGYQYKSEIMKKWKEMQEINLNTAYINAKNIKEQNDKIATAGITTDAEGNTIHLIDDDHLFFGSEAIDAVEDLICDEYALELACEGTRFSDLVRIARHKTKSSPYGTNYGKKWFATKIAQRNNPSTPASSLYNKLTTESNWYMPMR